jgi:acyl dehydratase
MPINPDAVGATGAPTELSWTSRDAMLYALGVGAGTDELQFTTENTADTPQRALPTMAVILSMGGTGALRDIGTFNPAMLVHGSQAIELYGEIPVEGTVSNVGTVSGIWDKGSGALVEIDVVSTDVASGEPLFKNVISLFLRGEGGWGGDRGPSTEAAAPERAPDHTITYSTGPDQALLYRLSGDRNPLHSDPSFAARGGFDRPILHGLCTYGFTGRALLHSLCGSDPARFTSMTGRFAKPVFPGEDLTVEIWEDGDGAATFLTKGGDGRVVLDAGRATYQA